MRKRYAQDVRGNTAPLVCGRLRDPREGCVPPPVQPPAGGADSTSETSPAFHPGKRVAPFDLAFLKKVCGRILRLPLAGRVTIG